MRRGFRGVAILVVLVALASFAVMAGTASAGTARQADKTSFVEADIGGITTLDWAQAYQGDPVRHVSFELGGSLVEWDTSKLRAAGCNQFGTVADIKPGVAESWKWDAPSSSWIFKLRATAKSPAGNVIQSEDVRWNFERLIYYKQAVANFLMNNVALYGTVAGDVSTNPIKVIDKSTFALKVKTKTALDIAILTLLWFIPVDSVEAKKHATADDPYAAAWLKTNRPAYGPFQVSGFAPGSAVFMTANKNYWGPRGNIKKVIIKSIPDASTRRSLLEAGKVDMAQRLTFSDYIALTQKGKASGVKVSRCFSGDRTTILLSFRNKTLANLKVRQAIQLATNRAELAKGGYLGQYPPAIHGASAVVPYTRSAATKFPAVDIVKAKALLAEAGVPNGFDLPLIIHPSRPGPEVDQISVLWKAQMAKIGINVQIQLAPSAADFSNQFFAGNYQAMLYLEPPAVGDPFYSLNLYNTTASFQNTFGYNNAEYDKLVGEIRVTPPGKAREAKIAKVAQIIVETVPVIYVTDNIFLHAVRDRFTGWTYPPNGELYVYTLTATK